MARNALAMDTGHLAATRDRLKQVAERLFAERGFHRLSLRELSTAVGLYPGSLYAHFDSKDSLLQELIEDGYDALLESARSALFQASGDAALATLVRHHLAFRRQHPGWCFLSAVERRHLSLGRQAEIAHCEQAYEALFRDELVALGGSDANTAQTVVRQLLRLLDALLQPDQAPADMRCAEDWAAGLIRLAQQRCASPLPGRSAMD